MISAEIVAHAARKYSAYSKLPLLLAVVFSLGLQLATIYVPVLNPLFKTEPLDAVELGACLLMSSVVFFAVAAEKLAGAPRAVVRRGGRCGARLS